MKEKIHISQCMIVKNEEKNIERALTWGRTVMWEQIVVDTGSTDRTVDLARQMGAKVYSIEWQDDFAAAKNYAIDQAKGDWIVFLDADEYMTEEDAEKLPEVFRQLIQESFDGVTAFLHNLDDNGKIFSSCSHLRFFRNIPDIRYRRRIHEQLTVLSGHELRIMDGTQELTIYHTGYQGKASEEKKKNDRNRVILQKELEDHPEDPELLGYMGDEYFGAQEMKEAERWYRSAVMHMPSEPEEHDQRGAMTFTRLLMLLTEREDADWTEPGAVYQQAVQSFPKEADFDYIAGRYFSSHEQPMEGIRYLENALFKLEQYGCANRALFLAGNLGDAYDLLAKCGYETGELQKCVTYAVEHLKYEQYEMKPLFWLFKALFQKDVRTENEGQNRAVAGFLSKIYDFSSLKDRLFVVKAAQKAGCENFASYMMSRFFTLEEQEILGL